MIVLTLEPGEAEKLAEGAPNLQRRYGMPIHPRPYPRPASSEPACRAVVAARLHAPEAEGALLRRLRVRVMLGGLLDDPELIAGAADDVGLDPDAAREWCASDEVEAALQADIAAARVTVARSPGPRLTSSAARPNERRYTAPSYELRTAGRRHRPCDSGLQPGRGLRDGDREPRAGARPPAAAPATFEELLAWAGEPLATAEVALVMQLSLNDAREELRSRRALPAGADFYWS